METWLWSISRLWQFLSHNCFPNNNHYNHPLMPGTLLGFFVFLSPTLNHSIMENDSPENDILQHHHRHHYHHSHDYHHRHGKSVKMAHHHHNQHQHHHHHRCHDHQSCLRMTAYSTSERKTRVMQAKSQTWEIFGLSHISRNLIIRSKNIPMFWRINYYSLQIWFGHTA